MLSTGADFSGGERRNNYGRWKQLVADISKSAGGRAEILCESRAQYDLIRYGIYKAAANANERVRVWQKRLGDSEPIAVVEHIRRP